MFTNTPADEVSLKTYLQTGGFPEYVKSGEEQILQSLMEDIFVRDIAVRHSIRDVESLKQLAVY